VGTCGAVFAAHAGIGGAAPDASHVAVTVLVFSGGSLEAAVAVGSGTAVDAVFFIFVVQMKPVDTFGTAVTIGR